jgi:20S proteasome alpha/beta subunit
MEDVPSVDYIAKYIAKIQQSYTQRNSVRPFGCSIMVIGYDQEKDEPRLLLTEPSGAYSSWKAHAIGRNSKALKTYLENNYEADLSEDKAIKLAIEALLESVESEKQIEIAIMRKDQKTIRLEYEDIEKVVDEIKKEKEDN